MMMGELDMSRKVVGMDGSEWFPKIGVACLRCKKRGEVCYWLLESKITVRFVSRCLGSCAGCTRLAIILDECSDTRPGIISSN